MQLDLLFSMYLQLTLGVIFLLLALGTVSFVSGEDSYPQTVIFIGVVLIILSAGAVMYIENISMLAKEWVNEKRLSPDVLEGFEKTSTLFLFVFPFVTAAIGTNLISEVVTRNFTFGKKLTLSAVLSGLWDMMKTTAGLIILPIIPIAIAIDILFSLNRVLRRWLPVVIDIIGKVSRRTQLIILKVDIIRRNYNRAES